jgi:hypothetical protein
MLRFSPPKPPTFRSRTATWPDAQRPPERTVFSRRPPLELLTVVIDADLIEVKEPPHGPYSQQLLLAGLLTHEFITVLRYSDEGPPEGGTVHPMLVEFGAVPGWVRVGAYDPLREERPVVISTGEGQFTDAGMRGDFTGSVERGAASPLYLPLGPEGASEQCRADLIAAKAAEVAEADIFITRRPYLHTTGRTFADGAVIATPEQALPLVSLYLRAQGQYVTWLDIAGKTSTTLNPGSFYARGALELAPNTWTLLRALAQHKQHGGPQALVALAQAVIGRLQQAVTQRDVMYWALNQPSSNDAVEDALTAFDMALLALMGASDSAASITDQLLGLSGRNIGWQNKDWRDEVRAKSAAIDKAFQADGHHHALKVLTILRNTIHGKQLDPLTVASPDKQVQLVVELPPESAGQLLGALKNLKGGAAAWGVDTHIRDRHHAEPGALLDQLVVRTATMLDAVAAALPVGELAGVQTPSQPLALPFRLSMFGQVPGESILWLLGLSP